MPISTREIVESSVLRQVAEYPLPTTINKVTQNVYQINDKLLIIKELKDEFETDEWIGEFEVEFNSDDFKPFYSNHDFYIALAYKSWGKAACLLTPKDVKRLLSLEEGESLQTLTIKSIDDGGYEVENLITRKKLNHRIENRNFPRNFLGTVTLPPHIEDEFEEDENLNVVTDSSQINTTKFDAAISIENIVDFARNQNFTVDKKGQERFEIYMTDASGNYTEYAVAFLICISRARYIQVHLFETTSETYGKCVYSLRNIDDVDGFCEILKVSRDIQARVSR